MRDLITGLILTILGVLLLLCGLARGQAPEGACRLTVTLHGGAAQGSGVLVAASEQGGVILTAAHVCRGGGRVAARFGNGEQAIAEVVHADLEWDVAVLRCGAVRAAPLAIASQTPMPGDKIWAGGFGPDGSWAWIPGTVTGYAGNGRGQFRWLTITGAARQGDSGGPMVNSRSEVVGVMWGTDQRTVLGAYNGQISSIIETAWGAGGLPCRPGSGSGCCPTRPPGLTPGWPPARQWDLPMVEVPPRRQTPPTCAPPAAGPPASPPAPAAPAPPSLDMAAVRAEIRAAVNEALAGLKIPAGPQGPPGKDGKDGRPGPAGPQGPAAAAPPLDMDALAAEIAKRLPPIYVRQENEKTGSTRVVPVPLGQGFTLKVSENSRKGGE